MRTFKIDRLTDEQVESLLQEYKERYEKEVDNILETRSPNDYVGYMILITFLLSFLGVSLMHYLLYVYKAELKEKNDETQSR